MSDLSPSDLSFSYRVDRPSAFDAEPLAGADVATPLSIAPPDAPLAMPTQVLEHPQRSLLSGVLSFFRPTRRVIRRT